MNSRSNKTYTVSVIGFIGSGNYRVHVGKSCFIQRFLSRTLYCEDHLCVLSLSEFDSEVVGSSHWLYWGETDVKIDSSVTRLRIIEQCEFLDDHLFAPISVTRPYSERCLTRTIPVESRRLAYISKDQLGDESSFQQEYLPPGRLEVSVFMCLYDMTLSSPVAEQQASFLRNILKELSSSNLPLVLVTSKHDAEVSSTAARLLEESFVNIKKRWLKRRFCLVETSAKGNINVHKAFHYAIAAACGSINKMRHGCRMPIAKLDQQFSHLSLCLKRTTNSKIRYHELQSSLFTTGIIPSLFVDTTDCYRIACAASHPIDRPLQTLPSDGLSHNHTVTTNPGPFDGLPPTSFAMSLRPRYPMPPRLQLLHSLEGTLPVLPTPPPLLLSGPRSPGRFGPISCPSFSFASNNAHPTNATKPISSDDTVKMDASATNHPPVRIYLYGHEATVQRVAGFLWTACPLDRCRTSDGSVHHVWILPGHPTPSNASSFVERMDQTSERNIFPKSSSSAFSIPFNGVMMGETTNSEIPIANSIQQTSRQGRTSTLHHGLRVLTYSSMDMLAQYEIPVDGQVGSFEMENGHYSSPHAPVTFDVLLFWSSASVRSIKPELMRRGINLAARWDIPFMNADNSSGLMELMTRLLRMASGTDTSFYALRLNSTATSHSEFIDWTAFELADVTRTIAAVIGLSKYDGILTAIICLSKSADCLPNDTYDRASDMTVPPVSQPQRLLFLPPSVTMPSAIKLDEGHLKTDSWQAVPRFFAPHQLHYSLGDGLPNSDGTLRLCFIHYLTSDWSLEMRAKLHECVESILVWSHPVQFEPVIDALVLVALTDPTVASARTVVAPELRSDHAGLIYLQTLADTRGHSFHVMNQQLTPIVCDESQYLNSNNNNMVPQSLGLNDGSHCAGSFDLSKPKLVFLSVTLSNPQEEALHRRALEGHPSVWSRIPDVPLLPPVAHPYSDHSSPLHSLTVPTTSQLSDLRRDSVGAVNGHDSRAVFEPIRPVGCGPPSLQRQFQHPEQSANTRPNMVAIPWLPANVMDALHRSSPRATAAYPYSTVSLDSNYPFPPMDPTFPPAMDVTSVEEYYAELPRVPQRDACTLEQRQRRVNRPKRPCPRTSSNNSYSSSSSSHSSPPELSSTSNHSPRSANPLGLESQLPPPPPPPSSHRPTHPVDPINSECGVYAEVDDALANSTLPLTVVPCTASSNPVRSQYSYDLPYTGFFMTDSRNPCANTAPSLGGALRCSVNVADSRTGWGRADAQFRHEAPDLPPTTNRSSLHHQWASGQLQMSNGSAMPHIPPPTQPAPPPPFGCCMSSRPLPSITDPCVIATTNNNCPSCTRQAPSMSTHSCVQPQAPVATHLLPISSNGHQNTHNGGNLFTNSNTSTVGSVNVGATTHTSSTLDALAAAIRRPGLWLRASTSRRTRKGKS